MADHDISKMKVADLKKELKNRGLSTLGNKNELVDRLQGALIDGGDPLEDTAISEDLLEDDELNDDLLEEGEDKHGDGAEEDQMLKSPTPSEASKSESPEELKEQTPSKSTEKKEDPAAAAAAAAPQKKVALKRNISITIPTPQPAAKPASTGDDAATRKEPTDLAASNGESKSDETEPEKKIIKLNQLSAQERLELRAKKFGASSTPVASDTKLQARAARFGTAGAGDAAASTPNLDALKKRAERFGVSVSDKMTKLEQQEKLQKRQERFGGGGTTTTTSTTATESKLTATGKVAITAASSPGSAKGDYAERARLRLERFKNAA